MHRRTLWNAVWIAVTAALFFYACQQPYVRPSPPPLSGTSSPLPDEDPPYLSMAEEALRNNESDVALDLYLKRVEAYPDRPGTDLALIRAAEIFERKGRYRRSMEMCRALLRDFPSSVYAVRASLMLARNLIFGEYYVEAGEILDALGDRHLLKSEKIEAGILSASVYSRQGQWLRSARVLARLYEEAQGEQKERIRAQYLSDVGRLPESGLEELDRGVADTTLRGYIRYERCRRLVQSQDWPGARACLDAFLDAYQYHEASQDARNLLAQSEAHESPMVPRIACLLPLTGPYQTYGRRVLEGMLLSFQAFDPEMRDRMPPLLIRDSRGNPEEAARVVQELAEDASVLAVVGPLGSEAARAAARAAESRSLPIVTMTQAEGITRAGSYVFRNFLTNSMQIRSLIYHAYLVKGVRRFAVMYPETPYGRSLKDLFEQELRTQFLDLAETVSYDPEAKDFGPTVRTLIGEQRWARYVAKVQRKKRNDPPPKLDLTFEALFIPDDYRRVLLIAPQLAYHDADQVLLLGTNLWNAPDLAEKGGKYLENAVFVADFFTESQDEAAVRMRKEYQRVFGKKVDFFAAQGFDVGRMLAALVNEGHVRDRAELRDRLLEVRDFPGLTGRTSFRADGDVEKDLRLLRVRDDRIVPVQ